MKLHRKQLRALLTGRAKIVGPTSRSRWSAAVLASVVTFLITIFGFGFSAIGFWISIKQIDDLRLVVGKTPEVELSDKNIRISGNPELLFVNSGNREVGITNIAVGVTSLKTEHPSDRDTDKDANRYGVEFNAKPFVLKANEIHIAEFSLQTSGLFDPKKTKGGYELPSFGFKAGDRVMVCLAVTVVTPDSYVTASQKAMYILTFNDTNLWQPLFDPAKPVELYRTTKSAF